MFLSIILLCMADVIANSGRCQNHCMLLLKTGICKCLYWLMLLPAWQMLLSIVGWCCSLGQMLLPILADVTAKVCLIVCRLMLLPVYCYRHACYRHLHMPVFNNNIQWFWHLPLLAITSAIHNNIMDKNIFPYTLWYIKICRENISFRLEEAHSSEQKLVSF